MSYSLIANLPFVRRDSDGATIPDDPHNSDWQAYQSWLTAGNIPAPAPEPTQAQLIGYAKAKGDSLLATARKYAAAGATLLIDATQGTRTDLGDLAQWGATNPTASTNWLDNDDGVVQVTGAQFVVFAPLVGTYALSVYAVLTPLILGVKAGTITTVAAIDQAAWPV
jgi:hypothetical protein